MRHRRFFSILVAATLWMAVAQAGAPAAAQQRRDQMPVFRAGVELVVVNVAVLDDDGEAVTGLGRGDFRLFEDGVEQEITLFAGSDDVPLDVALLLDVSGSIGDSAPTVREDAQAFLSSLGPNDCVYLLPFRQYVETGNWGAASDGFLGALIEQTPLSGGTALYDAVFRGLSNVDRTRYATEDGDPPAAERAAYDGIFCGVPLPPPYLGIPGSVRRTAIVLLSDGADEHSGASYADTLVAAWSGTVPIFSVAIGGALPPRRRTILRPGTIAAIRYQRARDYARGLEERLGQLARVTGGRLIRGTGRSAVREAFGEVVTMLRSSYLIGYDPPPEEEVSPDASLVWHDILVETPGRNAELYVRPGYYRSRIDTKGAESFVRDGLERLRAGESEDAIEQFGFAMDLDPSFVPAYLQRARALSRLERFEEARDDLGVALGLEPGLGGAEALLSEVSYRLRDYDAAWRHGIRAQQAGYDVDPLFDLLRSVGPAPEDLEAQLDAVPIYIDVGPTPPQLDQIAMLDLLRAFRAAASEATDVALAGRAVYAEHTLFIDVRGIRGRPRELEGRLVVYEAPGERIHEEDIEIEDLDDLEAVRAAARRTFERVRAWLAERN